MFRPEIKTKEKIFREIQEIASEINTLLLASSSQEKIKLLFYRLASLVREYLKYGKEPELAVLSPWGSVVIDWESLPEELEKCAEGELTPTCKAFLNLVTGVEVW